MVGCLVLLVAFLIPALIAVYVLGLGWIWASLLGLIAVVLVIKTSQ
jgi:hypothetical protein